jgi:hypothetical protein
MKKELIEADPEEISSIRERLDVLIVSNRRYKFQNLIKGLIEGVFTSLFGHVLEYTSYFRNLSATVNQDPIEFAKIPEGSKIARSFVQVSICQTSNYLITPMAQREIMQGVLFRDD